MSEQNNPRFNLAKRHIALAILVVLFAIWAIKPTDISIECLGCVTVKPDTVSTIAPKILPNNADAGVAKTAKPKPPNIDLHQTCVGEIRLPRRIAPLPPIPDHIKSNPRHYIDALNHQLETQTVQINEYQNHIEEIIERYNLTCY